MKCHSNGKDDFGKLTMIKITNQINICVSQKAITYFLKGYFHQGPLREMTKIVVQGLNLERLTGAVE